MQDVHGRPQTTKRDRKSSMINECDKKCFQDEPHLTLLEPGSMIDAVESDDEKIENLEIINFFFGKRDDTLSINPPVKQNLFLQSQTYDQ